MEDKTYNPRINLKYPPKQPTPPLARNLVEVPPRAVQVYRIITAQPWPLFTIR
jgi:hypothetical protein